jgi:hypothetical protein
MLVEQLQNQVEWVLETEGPLSTIHLVKIINAFPANTHRTHGDSSSEIFIRSTLNHLKENGKIVFDSQKFVWQKVDGQTLAPKIDAEQITNQSDHVKIGQGPETVYCIYKSLSRYRAAISGTNRWPIKIGKTKRPLSRRLLELKTSSEEALVVGLEIATDDSHALEAYIHQKLQFCRIENQGAGLEWFWSNDEQVHDHYRSWK